MWKTLGMEGRLLCLLLAGAIVTAQCQDLHTRFRRGARSRAICTDNSSAEMYHHRGTWLRLSGSRIEYCRCDSGRSRCHTVPVRACTRNKCYNGGQCSQAYYSPQLFVCQCHQGFSGKQCEIDTEAQCYKDAGVTYRGTWRMTESGTQCLNWNSNGLLDRTYSGRREDAAELGLGNHNYCRNPDEDSRPWCYIYKGGKYTWEHCSVPSCSKVGNINCKSGRGTDYRGGHSVTSSGATCLRWNSRILVNKLYTAWRRDAYQLGLGSHNFCRNPDNDSKPWCHVLKGNQLTWEYCNVPTCSTCGLRQRRVRQHRIKGGSYADIAAHPWQAAIFVKYRRAPGEHFLCGGILISSCWVLSAAHCFEEGTREKSVRELLHRHCQLAETPESWAKETFLTQRLCVPPEWIHQAKAVRARVEGDRHKEALFLFKAGHWNQCHKLVVRHLASDAIINENYKYLKGFLEDLAPPERSALIQDWDTAGLVYLDYIRVIEMLDRIQQLDCSPYELERLHTKVMSLCNRIEQIQCHSAKDRLAQSDMAKRVANLLRAVLSLQPPPEPGPPASPDPQRVPLRLLAPHVGRLPMPEDYALEELRGLTQSYLRELAVTH